MTSNYIEFEHDQSKVIVSYTFTNISTNARLFEFEIVTAGFFEYDGWWTYYRYEDDTKTNLLDKGKLFLNNPEQKTVYNKTNTTKKIYKR